MAEAVVEERPPANPRFYCHMCDEEINIPRNATDFICPICSGGFVEELPPASSAVSSAAPSSSTSSNNMPGIEEQQLESIRGQIANLLASRNGPNLEININPNSARGSGGQPIGQFVSLSPAVATGGGRVRPQSLDRLDNVLLDFLQSISVVGALAGEVNPFDNSQLLFMGNLGDYAWGREGLDTIVTQLLNQMETSGPPPLAKDKINDIPKVEVAQEEVERKLQCSVCWEDFKLNETVRKLPCSHLFHEDCIVPWLNLHGTCPICRKSLSGEEEDDNDVHMDSVEEGASASDGGGNCPLHSQNTRSTQQQLASSADQQPGTSSSNTATQDSSGTSQQQQQQNSNQARSDNIFGFEKMDSVDLD